jgi:hypothetical protein
MILFSKDFSIQLELFVAFSKVNNEIALKETTARQLAKSEKRKNLAST